MALTLVSVIPGAPPNIREAVEAAHTALHHTRCQGWLAATGNRADVYAVLTAGRGRVAVRKVRRPQPRYGCEFHPVDS